jgi:BNR repeat-like domain
MKSTSLFLSIVVFFYSCKEQPNTAQTQSVIGTGQMPAMARDNSGNLHLVYGTDDSIMYTFSSDNGISFSAPFLIHVLPELAASHSRGPQVTASVKGLTVTACNKQGDIFSYLKDDSGIWKAGARVNDADTVSKEGLMALSADGHVTFAVWLDLRDKHNKIFGAKSTDGGITWSANKMIYSSPDTTVCECCKPSVAVSGEHVYVMFRNWLNGNRDMYLIQSTDEGNTFSPAQKLGNGSWALNGCPMDGGGLAVSKDGIPQTVWRRQSKIYAAIPGAIEKEIGEGKGCTIETVNGKNIYAWSDGNGDIICLLPGGIKKTIGKGKLPILKPVSKNEIICVWQQDNNIKSTLISLI